jgi:hypothetical protein
MLRSRERAIIEASARLEANEKVEQKVAKITAQRSRNRSWQISLSRAEPAEGTQRKTNDLDFFSALLTFNFVQFREEFGQTIA